MDTIPIGVELVAGAIILALVLSFGVRVAIRLSRSRCPHCGKYRAAREVSAEKQVTVHSHREEYDHQLGHTREISETVGGYLVTRQCRFCDAKWERLETR